MKIKTKKISVIIPCYNVGLYIDRCITSIINQTTGIENLEIICVDDASIDDTWSHLQKWEQCFPENIILIQQEKTRRPGAARNLGLLYASAEWIAFVDADDWLERDYFEQLYEPVLRYECDVVACRFVRDASIQPKQTDKKMKKRGKRQYIAANTKEIKKRMLRDGSLGFGPFVKIIRKKFLIDHEIFFPEELAYEDMYWLPLLSLYAEKVYIIEESLYHYFVNPNSITLHSNASHHMDMLSIQLMKWTDYERRGLYQEYREELERDALNDAVCTMTQLIVLQDKPSFSFFMMERELIRKHIPTDKYAYYRVELDLTSALLLDILYSSLDETGFYQIIGQVKERLVK